MLSLRTRVGESLTCGGECRAEASESSPRPSAGGGGVLYRLYDLELSRAIGYAQGSESFVREFYGARLCKPSLPQLSSASYRRSAGCFLTAWFLFPTLGICRRCQHGNRRERYDKFTHASFPSTASQFTSRHSYRPK